MAINILDSFIANRISAGEVVEKPASIVKELIDNALDAGATEINIDIINGGIDLIAIRDNGCGIEPDDVKKAFLPHATSKISKLEDLDSIETLGFRGEALASISSVSQVTMVTKTSKMDYATELSVNGGIFGDVKATASQNGTYIEVRNLFFNTPARRKFLRRPKTEESEITNFISRYILAHPDIKLRYTANEKVVFDNKGGDLLNAIACVYGVEVIPHLEKIDYTSGYLKIEGYVGKISYTKPNTTYQTLLVNGRYVIDEGISKAVYSAYEEFLMSRQFPFYVINLTMPYNEVDVNVHPNKMNVKFAHPNEMFDVFYRAVRQTIYKSLNPIDNSDTSNIQDDYRYDDKVIDGTITFNDPFKKNQIPIQQDIEHNEKSLQDVEIEITPIIPVQQDLNEIVTSIKLDKFVNSKNVSMFDQEVLKSSEDHPNYQSINDFSDYNIVGELFNEFIILEK
ncbi:MAG: DNA mismatch repair endonuclease MutL, partial [Clostridia bacterium]